MSTSIPEKPKFTIKEPKNLSPRIQWLRDYYFKGVKRKWNNEFTAWTMGTDWDFQFQEGQFYIVPEMYNFLSTFTGAFKQTARKVELDSGFWKWSLPERRAWFVKEVMIHYLPKEILPGDLIAGARFNVETSTCLTKVEAKEYQKMVYRKNGIRATILWFHNHGYGNLGATSGHLIPDYPAVVEKGWKSIYEDIMQRYEAFPAEEKNSRRGAQLRAMLTAATTTRDLAAEYSDVCTEVAAKESEGMRKEELLKMADILKRVPWEPAKTFWEGLQSIWLTHMLCMSDEGYPGAGLSFGRIDQYLYPLWQKSLDEGMDREFGKEILKCFWIHANTVYDAWIRINGNQGITAGFGQMITLSGMGVGGKDMTNDLTYAILEVVDEMNPILEPKPSIRLHRNTPDQLYDKLLDIVASSQGVPFFLNFDERSMAGLMLEARKTGFQNFINENNIHDYAPVGCLENTMCGNDRSGTVDINLNLLKAVELALTGGYDLLPFTDPLSGNTEPTKRWGADTGNSENFRHWEEFWNAYVVQTKHIIGKIAGLYEKADEVRAKYISTPYLSCLIKGCAEKGLDINQGGPELNFATLHGVTYATTVDSLLAIKYLVFDNNVCTMKELVDALKANWTGYEVLQATAINKAPKYGRDDDKADELGKKVMELWTEEVWKYQSRSTGKQLRPGMLSWNFWISDADILPASPDGRPKGKFLSNAICPSNGADINGPTANANSVGKVIGGKDAQGKGDWQEYCNLLPNGASHTMTFNPSLIRDAEHKNKFKAFLRGYVENGGTCLQMNMVNADMLREAQKHPEDYRNLLVRVTGYNAYFTSLGRELQTEIIARESHQI